MIQPSQHNRDHSINVEKWKDGDITFLEMFWYAGYARKIKYKQLKYHINTLSNHILFTRSSLNDPCSSRMKNLLDIGGDSGMGKHDTLWQASRSTAI